MKTYASKARRLSLPCAMAGAALSLAAGVAQAYTIEKVYYYNQPPMVFNVLAQASNGMFYGTSVTGETGFGDVFKLDVFGNLIGIYDFSGPDGYAPGAGLALAPDGYMYGTTQYATGSSSGCGTIYKISTTGALTKIFSLTGNGTKGCNPESQLLLASDGMLYGSTPTKGQSKSGKVTVLDDGTIFKVSTAGAFTQIYGFAPDPVTGQFLNGQVPSGGFVEGPDGFLYGTTELGGAYGYGVVYKISKTGELTKLHDFSSPDGAQPDAGVVFGPDGALYGTTVWGGSVNAGTVFRITTDGQFTKLADFDRYVMGYQPNGLMVARDGDLYGTTYSGGANNKGTLYKITSSGSFTKLYDFDGSNTGKHPTTPLVQAADGALYGATDAAVFRVLGVPTTTLPTVSVKLVPDTIPLGGSTMLSWNTTDAETCTATSGLSGAQKTQGTKSIYVATSTTSAGGPTTYAFSCKGPAGTTVGSAVLTVVPPPPTLTLTADPATLPINTYSTLTWAPTNAASCTSSGAWSGSKTKTGGSKQVTKSKAGVYNYTVSCSNSSGSVSQTVAVTFQ